MLRSIIARVVDFSTYRHWPVIVFFLLIATGAGVFATRHFAIDTNIDHLLSTFVFVAFLVEFLLVKGAAHSVFFILMVITLVDLLAGFSVTVRSAGRDVSISQG